MAHTFKVQLHQSRSPEDTSAKMLEREASWKAVPLACHEVSMLATHVPSQPPRRVPEFHRPNPPGHQEHEPTTASKTAASYLPSSFPRAQINPPKPSSISLDIVTPGSHTPVDRKTNMVWKRQQAGPLERCEATNVPWEVNAGTTTWSVSCVGR